MSYQITSGKIDAAQKIVIYGPEGIGKSTFAAGFPVPLFIDTEGSTKRLDVVRLPKPTSWEMLLEEVAYVASEPGCCGTLVIDTLDWAEQLCSRSVCEKAGKKSIEDFGYGKGYVIEKEAFARLLHALDDVIDAGVHVVLTAHAQLRKVEQPEEMGGYDHWEMKLGAKTTAALSPLVKEWADTLLFANYKTVVVAADDSGNKYKAQGGRRVMYTTHTPWWDAKNREGLPEELDLDASLIVKTLKPVHPSDRPQSVPFPDPEKDGILFVLDKRIPKELRDLMEADCITTDEIKAAVAATGYYPIETEIHEYDPEFIKGAIIGGWEQLKAKIKNN